MNSHPSCIPLGLAAHCGPSVSPPELAAAARLAVFRIRVSNLEFGMGEPSGNRGKALRWLVARGGGSVCTARKWEPPDGFCSPMGTQQAGIKKIPTTTK